MVWLGISTHALAQACSATIGSPDFGLISLPIGTSFYTSAPVNWTCTGTPGATITGCINIGNGTGGQNGSGTIRNLKQGGTNLQFQLYKDAGYSVPWGGWNSGIPTVGQSFSIPLDAAGNGTAAGSIYASIFSGQGGLPTGVYSSNFPGGNSRLKFDYSTVGPCSFIAVNNGSPGGRAPLSVQAENITVCTIAVTTMDFGTTGVIASNIDATSQLTVTCSNGVPYTLALGGGISGATDPTLRQMTFAVANQVTYGIYSDAARTNGWGDNVGTNTVAGTGTGFAQLIDAYGRVPTQTTPTPGTYVDTVVVTVTY